MNHELLNGLGLLSKTDEFVHIAFARPLQILSSAVLNGGLGSIEHFLNLRVPKESPAKEQPSLTLARKCQSLSLAGKCVGMMTAASMNSLRLATTSTDDGCHFTAVVTTGLANVRRAGDVADSCENELVEAGTINLVVITDARLTGAAMVEAMAMVTEAKVAAMDSLNITSPVSQRLATGTGTDATAIISDPLGKELQYIGKHLQSGQRLAESVIEALSQSLAFDLPGNK